MVWLGDESYVKLFTKCTGKKQHLVKRTSHLVKRIFDSINPSKTLILRRFCRNINFNMCAFLTKFAS